MPFQTRSQRDMERAATLVATVVAEEGKTPSVYQGLCHQFPVFVLQCGLAQAVAFCASKAGNDAGIEKAHRLLLDHFATVLGFEDRMAMVSGVRTASLTEYMRLTRRTLDAAIFFKRFAEALIEDVSEVPHANG